MESETFLEKAACENAPPFPWVLIHTLWLIQPYQKLGTTWPSGEQLPFQG